MKAPDHRIQPYSTRPCKRNGFRVWLWRSRTAVVALGLLYNKINSQSDLPHGMRHALERQPPLAARRPGPVLEQARLAEVEVAPTRGGTRVPHAPDRTHFAGAARRPHVHVRGLVEDFDRDALARGRGLEDAGRRDDYA